MKVKVWVLVICLMDKIKIFGFEKWVLTYKNGNYLADLMRDVEIHHTLMPKLSNREDRGPSFMFFIHILKFLIRCTINISMKSSFTWQEEYHINVYQPSSPSISYTTKIV